MGTLTIILVAVGALIAGGAISYFMWDKALEKRKNKVFNDAIAEAEVIRKEKELQAKEK